MNTTPPDIETVETPRTDAERAECMKFDGEEWCCGFHVKVDFARTLERENAALRQEVAEAQAKVKKFGDLEAQLESYKEQWKRFYEQEVEGKCADIYAVSHSLGSFLKLEEYTPQTIEEEVRKQLTTERTLRQAAEAAVVEAQEFVRGYFMDGVLRFGHMDYREKTKQLLSSTAGQPLSAEVEKLREEVAGLQRVYGCITHDLAQAFDLKCLPMQSVRFACEKYAMAQATIAELQQRADAAEKASAEMRTIVQLIEKESMEASATESGDIWAAWVRDRCVEILSRAAFLGTGYLSPAEAQVLRETVRDVPQLLRWLTDQLVKHAHITIVAPKQTIVAWNELADKIEQALSTPAAPEGKVSIEPARVFGKLPGTVVHCPTCKSQWRFFNSGPYVCPECGLNCDPLKADPPPAPTDGVTREALLKLIYETERSHFRTTEDTGANHCALLIWNIVRRHVGLPWITQADLPKYDKEADEYLMPENSGLTTNERGPAAYDSTKKS